jgi:cation diffusion facilitator family transporter
MANCCEDKRCGIDSLREQHRSVLWVVLGINGVMFIVEGSAGLLAHSTALLADALDMLGDALVYGFSLFVLARSLRWQAGAALGKSAFMLAFGLAVFAEAGHKLLNPVMPGVITMGVIGMMALVANLCCFVLLFRHRHDNINMRSTWVCSRNDLAANMGVLVAAVASYEAQSLWPDILIGAVVAALFVVSALRVLRQARVEFRRARAVTLSPPVAPIPVRKHVVTADMPPRPVSPGAGE